MSIASRLFGKKAAASQPRPSAAAAGRADQPDLAGRRAFLARHILLHTHVPKTAGSSLSAGLQAIVGGVNSMDLRLMRKVPLEEMSDDDVSGLHLISGHFSYGIHERFDRIPLYFAALRDPVERAVSNYRFLSEHRDHDDHRLVAGRSFEEAHDAWTRHHGVRTRNAQSRVLLGGEVGPIDRETLWQQADDVYLLVIPQPEMNRTLNALRAAFGVPWNRPVRMNVSKSAPVEVTPAMRERLLAENEMDQRLYDRVSEDYDARLARACETIASHCLKPLEGGAS